MNIARIIVSDKEGNSFLDLSPPIHVAELIVRALLFGRRNFSTPLDESIAVGKINAFLPWAEGLEHEVEVGVATSALGTKYEEQLKEAVLQKLGISSAAYAQEVWGTHSLFPSLSV